MILETARLELRPLGPDELRLWLEDLPALESALGCSYRAEPLVGALRDIVAGQYEKTRDEPERWLWHSFWLLIRRSGRVVIGSADFKAPLGSGGEVELGYGLGAAFRHCGYMTEAVAAMTSWAFSQEGVERVVAETGTDNAASRRVLERCGFHLYRKGDTLWWKTEKGEAGFEH